MEMECVNKRMLEGIVIESDNYTKKQRYDECNAFILPSKKIKKREIIKETPIQKPLSKKKKKRLQKILERKKRNIYRAEIIQKLKNVQMKPEESDLLTSTSTMQTSGLKKFSPKNYTQQTKKSKNEELSKFSEKNKAKNSKVENEIVQKEKKKKRARKTKKNKIMGNTRNLTPSPKKKIELHPNINGFEESTSSKYENEIVQKEKYKEQEDFQDKEKKKKRARQTKKNKITGSKRNLTPPPKKKIKLHPNINGFEESTSCKFDSKVKDLSNVSEKNKGNENNGFEESTSCKFDSKVKDLSNVSKKNKGNNSKYENEIVQKEKYEEQKDFQDEENASLFKMNINETIQQPTNFVFVPRLPEIQAARESLPIFSEESTIIEAINENSVVILYGATGTGKTTQVPQFLYEARYAMNGKMIGITEPRRIAAMSMANRVAEEMNLPDLVSYHIRYEKTTTEKTRIKFMTDGILLQEIKQDYYLSKYSVIIIDEAHERTIYSDILIGLLSGIIRHRSQKGDKLKLVIMSATIRLEDFMENKKLFPEKPFLIELPSCHYRVVVHFQPTPDDYFEAAYDKVCKIHLNLPYGGILVFLTGQNEILRLCKRLRETFPFQDKEFHSTKTDFDEEAFNQFKSRNKYKKYRKNNKTFASFAHIDIDDYSNEPLDSEDEENNYQDFNVIKSNDTSPLYVLPLYSTLTSKEQEKIFKPPPFGSRLCVVSTNIAETSITIPNLKYVVDSGKVKIKQYDNTSGFSRHVVTWISKASANQRTGRAGRTQGGHCYRLYSSALFNHVFPDYSLPEMQVTPVDDVYLQLKALGIPSVIDFPFPSPPDRDSLKAAEKRLILFQALGYPENVERWKSQKEFSAEITSFGKEMSRLSMSPRYARMLVFSKRCPNIIQNAIALVSALSVSRIFNRYQVDDKPDKEKEVNRLWKGIKNNDGTKEASLLLGDAIVILKCVGLYEEAKNKFKFCKNYQINYKVMNEIHEMRKQLTSEMNQIYENLSLSMDLKLNQPSSNDIECLRKFFTCGFPDHIARRIPPEDVAKNKNLKNGYQCLELDEPVFIHPSSILFSEKPEFIAYQEMISTSKKYMLNVVEIEPSWLPVYVESLCQFGDPHQIPPPTYSQKYGILCNMAATFGRWNWEVPCIGVKMPQIYERYKWFCYFLLKGEIFPFFKVFKDIISPPPSYILTSVYWQVRSGHSFRNNDHFQLFLSLEKANIDTKEALHKKWTEDPYFLLEEYLQWFKNSNGIDKKKFAMVIRSRWPPIKIQSK